MSTTREILRSLLMEFNRNSGALASALVTRDGILISSALPEDVDAEAFAAMTATMVGAAETAFSELKAGAAERVIVEGSRSKIVAVGAGENVILVAMAPKEATLGLILHEIRKVSDKIKKVLS
ncbi:MAG: roadblock/LC7 domain-containing protein [Thaumarchaeota archaeon]|nr:roadblock/LC7 domain-containing protein [Nitrososphaerota archaeon]